MRVRKLPFLVALLAISVITSTAGAQNVANFQNDLKTALQINSGQPVEGWSYWKGTAIGITSGPDSALSANIENSSFQYSSGVYSKFGLNENAVNMGTCSVLYHDWVAAAGYTFSSDGTAQITNSWFHHHSITEMDSAGLYGFESEKSIRIRMFLETSAGYTQVGSTLESLAGLKQEGLMDLDLGDVKAGDTIYVTYSAGPAETENSGEIALYPFTHDFSIEWTGTDVPEPATMALLAAGGIALLRRRNKKNNA